MSLSIIVPAFNEERRLPQTLKDIAAFLDQGFFDEAEVIVVDDGSTDRTAALVRGYSKEDSRFRLLENPGNQGKGYAVRQGMRAASFEWRLMTDADLSTPIDEVRKLYKAMEAQNASVAIGSRALDRGCRPAPIDVSRVRRQAVQRFDACRDRAAVQRYSMRF